MQIICLRAVEGSSNIWYDCGSEKKESVERYWLRIIDIDFTGENQMNIQYLKEFISRITEIKIIGRTTEVNGVIYHIMGIVRDDRRLRFLALQYDEDFAAREEEAGIEELNAPAQKQKARSNRECLRCGRKIDPVNIFWAGGNVKIGETQFDIKETENRRCDMQNWEIAVLFTEFLRCGWNPTGIDDQNIENMFLTIAI